MSNTGPPFDLGRLLHALVDHGVDFVVIGGLAAIAHGSRRTTLDLDVVPCPSPENFIRLAEAVQQLDVDTGPVVDGELQRLDPGDDVDLARSRNVSLRTGAGRLDVLNRAKGAPYYPDLVAGAVRLTVAGVEVLVAGLDDLVAMKLALARPKDLQDVADMTAHEAGEYPSPPS
jgi:predicted nucleotidyltransferase